MLQTPALRQKRGVLVLGFASVTCVFDAGYASLDLGFAPVTLIVDPLSPLVTLLVDLFQLNIVLESGHLFRNRWHHLFFRRQLLFS
jgi:hypothetical protein